MVWRLYLGAWEFVVVVVPEHSHTQRRPPANSDGSPRALATDCVAFPVDHTVWLNKRPCLIGLCHSESCHLLQRLSLARSQTASVIGRIYLYLFELRICSIVVLANTQVDKWNRRCTKTSE